MISIGNKINDIYKTNLPTNKLTLKEEKHFQKTKVCEKCLLSFKDNNF